MDKERINSLPDKPGVYIYRDINGTIIYIGKTKSLIKRVRSYFGEGKKDMKTAQLAGKVHDIDYIVTKNELEAFILENSLIKEHSPYYNIMLKDDKSYPYIKVTVKEKYPGVYLTRSLKDKEAVYYGPYFALDAKRVLKMIYEIFRIRQCTYEFDDKPLKRPCIFYDTGMCSAPCVRFVSEAEYAEGISGIRKFLGGKYRAVEEILAEKMALASKDLKYEKAAMYRDAINAVRELMAGQKVVFSEDRDTDVISFSQSGDDWYVCVLNIRSGRLLSKRVEAFANAAGGTERMAVFLYQYYKRGMYIPEEIVMPEGAVESEEAGLIFKGSNVKIRHTASLLKMADENIHEKIKENEKLREKRAKSTAEFEEAASLLMKELGLPFKPSVIDGLDISHLHGENTVASAVVFTEGEPDRKRYRRYKIKTVKFIDDFSSMNEAVSRRYSRIMQEGSRMPDLILIDGGIGQVNAAKEALDLVGVSAPVIGLAKREELVYFPGRNEGIKLPDKAKFLLMRVRDEAHRFAVSYQFLLANKKLESSLLEKVEGIGEKTAREIYRNFKSTDELIEALEKNDERAEFINKKQREELIKYFKK